MTTAPTRIVVGVDGSPGSAQALRWAADEADRCGAALTAVTAWGFLEQHPPDGAPFDPHFDETTALANLRDHLDRALGAERAPSVEARAICDLPARALVEAASDADLLVVGARGLGGFKGLLLGSVSQHCLQHANVPVAVVRAPRRPTPHPARSSSPSTAPPPAISRLPGRPTPPAVAPPTSTSSTPGSCWRPTESGERHAQSRSRRRRAARCRGSRPVAAGQRSRREDAGPLDGRGRLDQQQRAAVSAIPSASAQQTAPVSGSTVRSCPAGISTSPSTV